MKVKFDSSGVLIIGRNVDLSSLKNETKAFVPSRIELGKKSPWNEPLGPDTDETGAAGELAALTILGLPLELNDDFDKGTDFFYHGYAIDAKGTKWKNYPLSLQWKEGKPIKCDIVMISMVDLETYMARPIGWAWTKEVLDAPVNQDRTPKCHEIPFRYLHSIQSLKDIPWRKSQNVSRTDQPSMRP